MSRSLTALPGSIVAALLICPATGQISSQAPRLFSRAAPNQISRVAKIVADDLTGELIQDVAILTNTGQLGVMVAPEVLTASEMSPWTGWTDIAAVPAPTPGASAMILGVISGGLQLVHYAPSTHFTKTGVTLPTGVGPLQRVVTKRVSSTSVLVLGIATDGVTVHVGSLDSTPAWNPISTFVSAAPVLAAAFHEVQLDGSHDVLLQTASGLAAYALDGMVLDTWEVPAGSTGGPFAPIVRANNYDRLAWFVHGSTGWRLRVLGRAGLVQELILGLPGLGAHFDLISAGSGDVDADGDFDLVVHQRTSGANGLRQYVLRNGGGSNPFSLTAPDVYEFEVPGVSLQDTAGVVVADMNNSGSADSVFATSSGLQVVTGVAEVLNGALMAPDYPDYIANASLAVANTGGPALELEMTVPQANANSSWRVEIATMHHFVADPHSAPHGAGPLDATSILTRGQPITASTTTLALVTPFATFMPGATAWTSNHHFYLRIRFVQMGPNNEVIGSSPTRLVGFLAHPDTESEATVLTYMRTLSTPGDGGERRVLPQSAGNKQVGHLKAPVIMSPPVTAIPADA